MLFAVAVATIAPVAAPGLAQEPEPAPEGWICRVSEVLPSGAHFHMDQSVDRSGGGYAIQARLQAGPGESGGPNQSWYWSLDSGEPLPPPKSLGLSVRLKTLDRQGRIVIDHDGGSISLAPRIPVLIRFSRTRGEMHIQDQATVAPLWASSRLRVSVLDRQGAVVGLVDNFSPPRSEVEGLFPALAARLAKMVQAPAGQCDEAGPYSTI